MLERGEVEVSGPLFLAFGQACINLNFYIDDEIRALFQQIDPAQWYPLQTFNKVLHLVAEKYSDPAPVLEQIGIEMMTFWYEVGPGKQHVRRGADFLRFQTSSAGYYSVIKGAPHEIGEFVLLHLDEQAGTAVVHSTTPFSRDMERGVLIGGLGLTQEFVYVTADNSVDVDTFRIEFH